MDDNRGYPHFRKPPNIRQLQDSKTRNRTERTRKSPAGWPATIGISPATLRISVLTSPAHLAAHLWTKNCRLENFWHPSGEKKPSMVPWLNPLRHRFITIFTGCHPQMPQMLTALGESPMLLGWNPMLWDPQSSTNCWWNPQGRMSIWSTAQSFHPGTEIVQWGIFEGDLRMRKTPRYPRNFHDLEMGGWKSTPMLQDGKWI